MPIALALPERRLGVAHGANVSIDRQATPDDPRSGNNYF
jgi:hypothetical protein